MKIHHDQLNNHLDKLYPAYLISGDEPFFVDEIRQKIRQLAEKESITEFQTITVSAQLNWSELALVSQNLSLFGGRKWLELRFNEKPNQALAKALLDYLVQNGTGSQANIVTVLMPKLDAAAQKQAWYIWLEQQGLCVPVWPLQPYQFPQWIKQRLKTAGLLVDESVVEFIMSQTNGNLAATTQLLEKLKLTHGDGQVDLEQVRAHSQQVSQYDIFALTDSCLSQQPEKISTILTQLKKTGVEPAIVLWALTRELRLLTTVTEMLGEFSLSTALQKNGVWEKRQSAYQAYFKKPISIKALYACFTQALYVDQVIKGLQSGDVWAQLLTLSLAIAGKPILLTRVKNNN